MSKKGRELKLQGGKVKLKLKRRESRREVKGKTHYEESRLRGSKGKEWKGGKRKERKRLGKSKVKRK